MIWLLALLCGALAGWALFLFLRLQKVEKEQEARAAEAARLKETVQDLTLSLSEKERQAARQAEEEEAMDRARREAEEWLAEEKERGRLRAAEMAASAMARSFSPSTTSSASVRVDLPSEDFKAKLIGREGRNIRSFELVTQTDLIVDETQGAVHVSCFDGLRREAARITLTRLIEDGRIHPSRIEEVHEETQALLPQILREEVEAEAAEAGVTEIPEGVLSKMGQLKLIQSEGQNVWLHSLECCRLAGLMAMELGVPHEKAARAALFHDLGKALGAEKPGPHALAGRDFLQPFWEAPEVLNAVAAHHGDEEPWCLEAHLVILADSLSASRPGARRLSREKLYSRMEDLERAALEFPGVAAAWALQAGRELRVMVRPGEVSDEDLRGLARRIASRLAEMAEYPAGVKVVVTRETRASEITP